MKKYWMAVASREHVLRGVSGGFAQVCHGKQGPLKLMHEGDGIIYYSPTLKFMEKLPCRCFTAIGQVIDAQPYAFQMRKEFIPWRRNLTFFPAKEVEITPLIDKLSFIHDKKRWGFPFRKGCFSIPAKDFHLIASKMGVINEF